ncbi:ABC transporter ATP-binding protein [Asanoa sp. NPDC049518]|uniref:ABC transporter ATP-binding protein n=1 Tax=unclassified Asanoa TaxID=2685164 RepID=UPI003432D85B
MSAIVVERLCKTFGEVRAVDDVSFSVEAGEIFALLGPNGAGKTTTLEILEGYRDRTAGTVRVLGVDPAKGGRRHRERIGVVLQSAGFEEEFTVRELVSLQQRLFPRHYGVDEVIDLVGLADKRTARVKGLSGGQRRRLDLALGVVGAPDLLFLDEPTTGFDPGARHRAWTLVEGLRHAGTTILLTTHYIEEAERLADRLAVMRSGRLIALGRPDELGVGDSGAAPASVVRCRVPAGVSISGLPLLSETPSVANGWLQLVTASPVRDLHELTGWAVRRGLDLACLTVRRPNLEDVYLRLVGEQADVH